MSGFPASSPLCAGPAAARSRRFAADQCQHRHGKRSWHQGLSGTGGGHQRTVFSGPPTIRPVWALPASLNDGAVRARRSRRGLRPRRPIPGLSASSSIGNETVKDGTSAATPLWGRPLIAMANAPARRAARFSPMPRLLRQPGACFRPDRRGQQQVQRAVATTPARTGNACTGLGVPKGQRHHRGAGGDRRVA